MVLWYDVFRYRTTLASLVVGGAARLIDNGFSRFTALQSIGMNAAGLAELPEGVVEACPLLESVRLPPRLKALPRRAFAHCRALCEIDLSDQLSEVGEEAFSKCGLTEIDLPSSVQVVGARAFAGCPLKKVTITDNVEFWGDYCFTKVDKGVDTIVFRGVDDTKIPAQLHAVVSQDVRYLDMAGRELWTRQKFSRRFVEEGGSLVLGPG
jgi:hypothetical protein